MKYKILQVKDIITPQLMAIPGVVGGGIQKGKIASYTKKTTTKVLSAIPLTIEGYGTKIIEIGEIFAFQDRTDKWRPAPGGVSIGHPSVTAGTLGVVIIDNTNGKRVILSNNHVLANKDSIQTSIASLNPLTYPISKISSLTSSSFIGVAIAQSTLFIPISSILVHLSKLAIVSAELPPSAIFSVVKIQSINLVTKEP